MFKKISKKIFAIAIAAVTLFGVAVPNVANADNSTSTTTEKVYLARANDPLVASQVGANFGGVKKTEPYNTYADSENGTRGAYVAANPAAVGAPFIHVGYDNGIDLTKTTGTVYVNLYWTGTASAGEMLVIGFSSETRDTAFTTANCAQWPLDLKAALDAGSLKQGWNVLEFPVGTQQDLPIDPANITSFRIYNANATGTTGLACGAVYAVDKNDSSKKYYFVNAQDEITGDTFANYGGSSMSTTYTSYDDGTCGAFVSADPVSAAHNGHPFMVLDYATPVSLADTTGKVTFNLYHTGTSEAADDKIIVRLNYSDGTNADTPASVSELENGWNAFTVDADTTKSVKGVLVYASSMEGATAVAAGSVYVTKEVPVSSEDEEKKDEENKNEEPKYYNDYLIEATTGEVLYTAQPGFVNAGFSNEAPYNAYGDNTRGAYKAKLPTAQVNLYDTIVARIWAGGKDLKEYTGIVTANIYFNGTDTNGPLVFSWFNTDGKQIEHIISSGTLKQGWNEVQINLATLEKNSGVSMQNLSLFYIYTTADMNDCTDLAIGSIYVQKPGEADPNASVQDRKTYLLEAVVSSETSPYECVDYFDINFNGYGSGNRGAYVKEGAFDSAFWFAKNLNNVDLSKAKYAVVNFYVDDPAKFTSMFIELSSGGTWDKNERNWVISSFNSELKKGWNAIVLDLNNPIASAAEGTIGYAITDAGGTYNAGAVNFMRVYGTYSGSKSAVGAIYLSDTTSPETSDNNSSPMHIMFVGALMLACVAVSGYTFFDKKAKRK